MKKVLSLIISVLMIITSFAAVPVFADAVASTEGNWEVHLDKYEEEKIENGEESYIPRPGYKYTDDGFEVIPPEYHNVQSKYTVISKTKYNTRDFSIKIRLDEYDASGDNWVSFTFWSEKHGLAQGDTNAKGEYGYGWTSLTRDANTIYDERDMKLSVLQGFSCGTKAYPGGYSTRTVTEFEPIVDENGIQYLEFKVVAMQIYINGVALEADNCKALRDAFKNDQYLAYFGISVKSGLPDTPIKFTIMEVDGVKPAGTDSEEPEVKNREFGEMIDASTIPAGTPGVIFDATFENQNTKLPTTSRCVVDISENDTFKVTTHDTVGTIDFKVRDDYSVDLNDFRYITVVLKNHCSCEREEGVSMSDGCTFGEVFGFFYCAGKTLAPDNEYLIHVDSTYLYDVTPEGSEDYYTAIVVPVNRDKIPERPARINSLRFDFAKYAIGEEFEIVCVGYFRNNADIASYVTSLGCELDVDELYDFDDDSGDDNGDDDPGDTGSEENTTEENYDDYPDMDDGTSEEVTTKKENKTTAASSDEDKRGCGSFVGMGAVAMIVTASVAGVVIFKKRKEKINI